MFCGSNIKNLSLIFKVKIVMLNAYRVSFEVRDVNETENTMQLVLITKQTSAVSSVSGCWRLTGLGVEIAAHCDYCLNCACAHCVTSLLVKAKGKGNIAIPAGNPTSELWDVTCHMGSHLPPDTSEHAVPNPTHAGRYSIYLLRRDGRLSWPSWVVDLIAPQPGVEPATFRSRVQHRTASPPRQRHDTSVWVVVWCGWCKVGARRHSAGICWAVLQRSYSKHL